MRFFAAWVMTMATAAGVASIGMATALGATFVYVSNADDGDISGRSD